MSKPGQPRLGYKSQAAAPRLPPPSTFPLWTMLLIELYFLRQSVFSRQSYKFVATRFGLAGGSEFSEI